MVPRETGEARIEPGGTLGLVVRGRWEGGGGTCGSTITEKSKRPARKPQPAAS